MKKVIITLFAVLTALGGLDAQTKSEKSGGFKKT